MFKDKLSKIKNSEKAKKVEETNQEKKIENTVFFITLLIITIISINFILNGKKVKTKEEINSNNKNKKLANYDIGENNNKNNNKNNNQDYSINNINNNDIEEDILSKKIEKILSNIEGVGEVKALINYSESSEVIPMYNENTKQSTTEETDTSGGTRKISQSDTNKDIIYEEQGGIKKPITKKLIKPKIEGAIITAKGANNIETKTNIIQAVEAVTGLEKHKIQVFEMK